MKYTRFIFIVVFSYTLIACGGLKNMEGEGLTVIDYKVKEQNVLKDTLWEIYHNMEPGIEKRYQLKNLKAMANPDPIFYTLKMSDSISKVVYHKPLIKDDGKSFHSWSNPLGGRELYRMIDSTGVYEDYSERIPSGYQHLPDYHLNWTSGKKDSIILGIQTHLMIGKNSNTKVRAWVTEKFPAELGIHRVHYDGGFILAYEIRTKYPEENRALKSAFLQIYPQEIDKINGKIEVPDWSKQLSEKEIEAYYRRLNERNN